MNVIDILIIFVLLLAALGGFRQGFIVEVAGIVGALVAFTIAHQEYADVRSFLAHFAPHSSWLTVISYLAVFLIVWAAIILVARRIRWAIRALRLGLLDRLAGSIIGLLQGALLVELLLYLAERVPVGQLRQSVTHSTLAPTFLHFVPYLHRLFPHIGA